MLLWWLSQNPMWTIKLLSTFSEESINMTLAVANSTRQSTNHNWNLGCWFRRPLMSRKFCGCSSKDKLQQDDFTGNGCIGDSLNSNNKTFVTLVVVWLPTTSCKQWSLLQNSLLSDPLSREAPQEVTKATGEHISACSRSSRGSGRPRYLAVMNTVTKVLRLLSLNYGEMTSQGMDDH